jgi:hypothetical protein
MSIYGALAEQTRRDEAIARGEVALDGSNPTAVVTGLKTITAVGLALKGTAAPGVGTSVLTYSQTNGTLNIYAWKVTASGNATLIASTGTETVSWVAIGAK